MQNQEQPEQNISFTPSSPERKVQDQPADQEENVFDNDLSDGKNSLGQNPEQILYDKPENVEDASQIDSDGNNK
ncbi:MAG: hypothetical protein COW65_02860 [Cytophagales bacterium CG18_big_fil_WC_8_21_14_2_50_42_9]|nr:MAG: hypothetical protein COW65_02860 [Cytophagales bacterium CG18_big_fil_WC_8_21_14_2_50_42_9]